jgi:plasmid stabilization system protein ParE
VDRRLIYSANHPALGGLAVPKTRYRTRDVRRIAVINYPYVVYYHVNDERVLILTVMHTAQDR